MQTGELMLKHHRAGFTATVLDGLINQPIIYYITG